MIDGSTIPRVGDLIAIQVWDCEGVEMPWGWVEDGTRPPDAKGRRMTKKKIVPGTFGIVIRFDHFGVDDYDTHYNVVVGGLRLGVPLRFIRVISRDDENQ